MGGSCDDLTGEPEECRDRGVLGFVGAVDFLLSRIVRGRVWGAVTGTVLDALNVPVQLSLEIIGKRRRTLAQVKMLNHVILGSCI